MKKLITDQTYPLQQKQISKRTLAAGFAGLAILCCTQTHAAEPDAGKTAVPAKKKLAAPDAAEGSTRKTDTVTTMDTINVVGNNDWNPPNQKPQLDVEALTGSRLGLTPRETPASITIIDRATFEKRGAQTSQEALERAPGVTVSSQPGSAGTVTLRGFSGAQITQLFNGISVQYDVIAARPIDSWLLDRVEVLGGPSTFLYGQGAVGGSVNYVSKIASRNPEEHTALLSIGEFLNRRASYGYGGQLGDTKNWLRADISYLGSEGYVDRTEANSGVFSVSLLSDLTDKLSHTIAVEHQIEDRDAYWGTPLLNPTINGVIVPFGDARITSPVVGQIDPRIRFNNYNSANPVFDQQVTWVRDILDFEINSRTRLKNTLYYYQADRQYRNVEVYDYNSSNTLISRSASFATDHKQNLLGDRIEFSRDTEVFSLPSKIFAGIDVAYNTQERPSSTENQANVVSVVNPFNFSVGNYFDNPLATGPIPNARNELFTVAGYAENRLTLLPKLNLVTGVRVDDINLDVSNFRTPTPPSAANPFGFPAFFNRDWLAVTWRAGLIYDITPTFNVYAQYSTAADPPSGILTTANPGLLRNFDLTTGRQAEVGTKFDFWQGRGSGTLAGYYIERKNLSTRDPNNPQLTIPVGAQSSAGVEANLGLQITPTLSIQGNMAYVDANFDEFNELVGGVNVSREGNRPTNIAEWVANGWLTWDVTPDWQWNFGARYVGDRFLDTANLIIIPEYAVFDTQLSWKFNRHATLTARVKNLSDELYAEFGNGGNNPLFILREPRTFQVEAKFNF